MRTPLAWIAALAIVPITVHCSSPDYIEIDDPTAAVSPTPRGSATSSPGPAGDAGGAGSDATNAPGDGAPTGDAGDCPTGDAVARAAGHCYVLFREELEWATARDRCAALGMHLATLTAASENDVVRALVPTSDLPFTTPRSWIGASDVAVEGSFVWVTGEALSFTAWASGQPDNGGEEDCATIARGGSWDDHECTRKHSFVCERD